MRVIFIYDISLLQREDHKRLTKILKIARRYLHHVQRSVFEGELTEGKLKRLETEILKIIDKNRDSAIIYTFPPSVSFSRKILTNTNDPTSNLIV